MWVAHEDARRAPHSAESNIMRVFFDAPVAYDTPPYHQQDQQSLARCVSDD